MVFCSVKILSTWSAAKPHTHKGIIYFAIFPLGSKFMIQSMASPNFSDFSSKRNLFLWTIIWNLKYMNQNRLKCNFVWWKQFFFNSCQVFPLHVSWMWPSGGQSAMKTKKHLFMLWSSYYPTIADKHQFYYKQVLLFTTSTKALKARTQISAYYCKPDN